MSLQTYNQVYISARGVIELSIIRSNNTVLNQTLYVIDNGVNPIMGRDWMAIFGMWS